MEIRRSKIFNDCKAFILKQMYAKNVTPARAKKIVMRVRTRITLADTPEKKQAFIDTLHQNFPELKPLQAQYQQAEHERFDEIIGEVAEKLLDSGDFDNISVLNDWYENEKPDDETIQIYITYHFPKIAKEIFGESITTEAVASPEETNKTTES